MPEATVVIPAYNAEKYIDETLQSIYAQTFRDFEIIVVDDGSTDSTSDILARHEEKSLIKTFRRENSGGCSIPRNDAIRAADSKYIFIFDADDLMLADKIERQMAAFKASPSINFVFTDFQNFDSKRIYERHTYSCPEFRRLLHNQEQQNLYVLPSTEAYAVLFLEYYVGASSIAFKRTLTESIGVFDPQLNSSEDADFVYRAARNFNIGFVDRVCHHRRLHDASMSSATERVLDKKIEVVLRQQSFLNSEKARRNFEQIMSQLYHDRIYFLGNEHRFAELLGAIKTALVASPTELSLYSVAVKSIVKSMLKMKNRH